MTDEAPKKRGRPKKAKKMVDTNVRVTKDTHLRLKTLADLWGITMSESIDLLIEKHAPEVEDAIRRRAAIQKMVTEKKSNPSNN